MKCADDCGPNDSIDLGIPGEMPGRHAPRGAAEWGRTVTAFIVEHPELCLAIAIALGAAIGVAVKRR